MNDSKGINAKDAVEGIPVPDKAEGTDVCRFCYFTPEKCICDGPRPPDQVFTLNFDLITHLERQRDFSERTFGPGVRTAGVCDHIRKELREIEADPHDLKEWVDVILLALDGAWRAGYTPVEICEAMAAKQRKNELRKWPDWRTADPTKAIEHDRSADHV